MNIIEHYCEFDRCFEWVQSSVSVIFTEDKTSPECKILPTRIGNKLVFFINGKQVYNLTVNSLNYYKFSFKDIYCKEGTFGVVEYKKVNSCGLVPGGDYV